MLLAPASAHANGAFPDSLAVLLPAGQAQRILVATNFGLAVSEDDGASWQLVCEEAIGTQAALYSVGPVPDERLFAITLEGLSTSSDGGCSWQHVAEPIAFATDVFPDPADAQHVLAVAEVARTDAGASLQGVFESHDGGESFDAEPRFTAEVGVSITGIEVARSAPDTLYTALYRYMGDPLGSSLARSDDAGEHWQDIDVRSALTNSLARILAIDEADASRVYLRAYDSSPRDRLAIYDAATGRTAVPLTLEHRMTAFLHGSRGELMVGSLAGAWISSDAGDTFTPWTTAPHLRALGERDGVIYAAADDLVDGYALGRSQDRGESWEPLLKLKDITGPLECGALATICKGPYKTLQTRLRNGPGAEETPALPFDAGSEPDAEAGEPGDGGAKAKSNSGCDCRALTPRSSQRQGWCPLLGLLTALMLGSWRRRGASKRHG